MAAASPSLSSIKSKKSKSDDLEPGTPEVTSVFVSPMAKPLAGKKLHKKIFKAVRKGACTARGCVNWWHCDVWRGAATEAKLLKRGVKEVVKAIRKGSKGLCVLAGDIAPMDVISHIPVFCEENGVAYVFVTSKAELGQSAKTKRPTSCVLLTQESVGKDRLEEVVSEVFKLDHGIA
jgi:H/ACA ribonucleoprotein complex subunit 2